MRVRRIAIFIDGGFFLKRLPHIVEEKYRSTPQQVAETARILCKRHVQRLVGEKDRWLDHVYRLFYYDAYPYSGHAHHPLLNQQIDFSKTPEAHFRLQLFDELRRKRKFALRLGRVEKTGDWQINYRLTKILLKTHRWHDVFSALAEGKDPRKKYPNLTDEDIRELYKLSKTWKELDKHSLHYSLRQKGVDMRLGIDIASITLKKQADTLILVTGDSDFVPAAKLARREGAEVILDPLRQSIKEQLHEHIDGLASVLP